MQSNDVIEVVTPLGGGISEVTLFPDAAAVLVDTAGVLVERGQIFNAAVRHLSSLESDISLFVRRIGIPVSSSATAADQNAQSEDALLTVAQIGNTLIEPLRFSPKALH